MNALRGLATLLVAVVAAAAAAPALAQTSSYYYKHQRGMDERFRLDLGGFFQKFETTVSLSNAAGTAGTDVSLEDDLGQDSKQTSFGADGYWRFGRHGRLDFAYRGWNRSNSHMLSKDIVFGGTTYRAGAQIDSRLRVNIAELYYAYSFVNNGDLELGLGLGFSTYFTAMDVSGSGTVTGGGGSTAASFTSETRSLVLPVPALKAYFAYALYPGLFASASFKGITGTISGYHADMQDFRGGFDYVFSKNFGLGGAYQYVKINASRSGTSGDLAFTYKYEGPLAYLILVF